MPSALMDEMLALLDGHQPCMLFKQLFLNLYSWPTLTSPTHVKWLNRLIDYGCPKLDHNTTGQAKVNDTNSIVNDASTTTGFIPADKLSSNQGAKLMVVASVAHNSTAIQQTAFPVVFHCCRSLSAVVGGRLFQSTHYPR